MSQPAARRAYSTEELLALRRSASDEPAVAIQNKARESAIKDHVVRGARSFAAQTANSFLGPRTHAPLINHATLSAPVLGEIDPNNQHLRAGSAFKTSPTPSLKKDKAEHLLKQHGSPPGLRVTAGGRIVPSDQSPLCSPRYGYSAITKNGGLIKFAPGYPPPKTFQQFAKSLPNGFVAQDPTGRLCQMVDGRFLPVHDVNGIPQLYITAPNLNNVSSGKVNSNVMQFGERTGVVNSGQARPNMIQAPTGPTVSIQILALEKQYQKLEVERRHLDKAEVLQRTEMTGKSYQSLIQKRRELINQQDELRRSIKALQSAKINAETPMAPTHTAASSPEALNDASQFYIPPHLPQLPIHGWPADMNAVDQQAATTFQNMQLPPDFGMYMPPPFFANGLPPYAMIPPYFQAGGMMPGGFQSHGDFAGTGQPASGPFVGAFPQDFGQPEHTTTINRGSLAAQATLAKSDGQSGPASDTSEMANRGQKSSLNPMSAIYEPARSRLATPEKRTSPSDSIALAEAIRAHNDWAGSSGDVPEASHPNDTAAKRQHSSDSSYATADFFPQNPRDHSMNKQSYPVGDKSEGDIAMEIAAPHIPSSDDTQGSPEKEKHNANWNPTIPDYAFRTAGSSSARKGESTSALDPIPTKGRNTLTDPFPDGTELDREFSAQASHLATYRSVTEKTVQDPPKPSSAQPMQINVPSTMAGNPESDLHQQPDEHIEGFRAGLSRAPIGSDKGKVFLDGYCAGLLKSAQLNDSLTENICPTPNTIRTEINPSPGSSVAKRTERRSSVIPRPPLELNTQSLDTLKQVMFGPLNENALLSPAEEGPPAGPINGKSLGTWSKSREPSLGVDSVLSQMRNGQAAFPERTSSMVGRQLANTLQADGVQTTHPGVLQKDDASGFAMATSDAEPVSRRDFSAQTQPTQSSYLHRAYSGHRVLSSPTLEWKSGSSIAHVAGLATGYFAQYDGMLEDITSLASGPLLTESRASGTNSKAATHATSTPQRCATSPRFREAFMPEDEPPVSGPSSPTGSPSKRTSPAKARFAQIAGKAGIKVGIQRRETIEGGVEDMSAQERRNWRDIWKKRQGPAAE